MARGPVDPDDPKGLVREAFRIERITDAECRSILIDWALSLPLESDQRAAAERLRARHGPTDHPMMRLLAEAGQNGGTGLRRRGGRAARLRGVEEPGSDA